MTVRISGRRLLGDIATLATFGGRPDGGVDRVAGSPQDFAARDWLRRRIEDAGLLSWTDEVGNVYGRAGDGRGPWLLTGSHTDTVPAGGRLDGAYGVMAALEALRALHEAHHPIARKIEIVSFWDEEGAQPTSSGGLVGSTYLCGSDHIRSIAGFVELHVEQGPRMEAAGTELAVVDGIVGIERHLVAFHGLANHAGTTPLALRADAGRAAAKLVPAVWEIARECDPTMVANAGFIEFVPGAPNVIPGEARVVVEFRASAERALRDAEERLSIVSSRMAADESCKSEIVRISSKPVAVFDPEVRARLDTVCMATGRPTARLFSYAGHDASVLNRSVPTGMLFVPSTEGISHAPQEDTPDHLLVQGCQALTDALACLGESLCS